MERVSRNEVGDTPFFPDSVFETLPPLLKEIVSPFKGRERDMALLTGLVLLSGCLDNVQGEYDGRIVYSMLYCFIIAPAAFGKGSIALIRLILNDVKQKLQSAYDQEFASFQQWEQENRKKKQGKDNSEGAKVIALGDLFSEPITRNPPKRKLLDVPGNSSAAALLKHLHDSGGQLILMETEADTVGAALMADWGNYSDLLRKSFHHEPVSSSRKGNDEYMEVLFPKLAMLLTGTPGQVQGILQSAENGLFSRIIYYYFNQPPVWRDVRPGKRVNLNIHYEALAPEVLNVVEFYEQHPAQFDFTEEQWDILNEFFIELLDDVTAEVAEEASSIVLRLGLVAYRIAMVITALRHYDYDEPYERIYCTDRDFLSVRSMVSVIYQHSVFMFNTLPKKHETKRRSLEMFLARLPKDGEFTRESAINIGAELGLGTRTTDSYLKQLSAGGLLEHVKQGVYKKK